MSLEDNYSHVLSHVCVLSKPTDPYMRSQQTSASGLWEGLQSDIADSSRTRIFAKHSKSYTL